MFKGFGLDLDVLLYYYTVLLLHESRTLLALRYVLWRSVTRLLCTCSQSTRLVWYADKTVGRSQ